MDPSSLLVGSHDQASATGLMGVEDGELEGWIDTVLRRIQMYTPAYARLPWLVKAAFQTGYRVSSIGMLCWTALPSAVMVPPIRARFIVLEAYFAIQFHAIIKMSSDKLFEHLVSWPRESVSWGPLCTHLPMMEVVKGDLSMSPEQLEIAAAARVKRTAERTLPMANGIGLPSVQRTPRRS